MRGESWHKRSVLLYGAEVESPATFFRRLGLNGSQIRYLPPSGNGTHTPGTWEATRENRLPVSFRAHFRGDAPAEHQGLEVA
jgi:hypothetical protein